MFRLLTVLIVASAIPSDTPNWHYRQTHDAMTDLTGGTALVIAQDRASGFGITCEISEPDRQINFRYTFPKGRYAPSTKTVVQVRVDKRPLFESAWPTVKNSAVAIYPSQVSKLIRELHGASELMIRAHDIDEQPVDATFNVKGAEIAIRWVLEECGWPNYPRRGKR